MEFVSMTEMLANAKENRYAIGPFNINNLEFAQAIVETANEEKAPVYIGRI